MLPSKYQWIPAKADQDFVTQLAKQLHLSPVTARLLIQRGADTPERADLFLHPEKAEFHQPLQMLGMQQAVQRIRQAISGHEKIRVFGDYDADGVTSTALLVRGLRRAGADVSYYIPDRFKDGYGPNIPAVESAAADGIRLIVTVDSGIAAREAAERAQKLAIDYIVTDHHEPPEQLPDAYAILNPKQAGCPYPFKELSGAGIALKLLQALFEKKSFDTRWLELAAIGTIADLVALRDENRLIASKGLQLMAAGSSFPGIHALMARAGCTEPADSETVGFQIGPRLNAAGRLENAEPALELLLSDDSEEAAGLADRLEELNRKRKALVEAITREALQQAKSYLDRGDKALVLAAEDWHQGVIGISASKIVEACRRPTIILSIDRQNDAAKGSGRSIGGFNLYGALSACSGELTQYGGHQMAAGLTLAASSIDSFREQFVRYAGSKLAGEQLIPKLEIASCLSPDQVTTGQINELAALAPFGTGNPKPIFQMNHVSFSKMKAIGRDQDHLKFVFKGQKQELDGIGFRLGPTGKWIARSDRLNVIGECSVNEWNGIRRPQFIIRDLRIDGLQLFDWRSEQQLNKRLAELPAADTSLLVFNEETQEHLSLNGACMSYRQDLRIHRPLLVLLDLPQDPRQLSDLIAASPAVHRIFAVFFHSDNHYLSFFPGREHFAWLFLLIQRHHSLPVERFIRQIASYKGWQESLVHWMIRVFFELGFVKIDKGSLTEVAVPNKKPLTASLAYRKEQEKIHCEELFCYSSITELKKWFAVQRAQRGEAALSEGTVREL